MGQLKQVNKKLAASEKLKSEFLSNIRNEIINPFASIMGFATRLMELRPEEGEKARQIGRLIHSEAFDLDFQLRNIFAAAEIEAGQVTCQIAQVDLYQLTTSVIKDYQPGAMQNDLSLELSFLPDASSPLMNFTGDADKIATCTANLLSNAVNFASSGSKVKLLVHRFDDTLQINVTNQGQTISEEDREKVFDRFVQLDTGMTKARPGHGLGLTVTRALAELMNGQVQLHTSTPCETVFVLTIPQLRAEGNMDLSPEANELFFSDDILL